MVVGWRPVEKGNGRQQVAREPQQMCVPYPRAVEHERPILSGARRNCLRPQQQVDSDNRINRLLLKGTSRTPATRCC